MVGAVFVGGAESTLAFFIQPVTASMLVLVFAIVALRFRPQGLAGGRRRSVNVVVPRARDDGSVSPRQRRLLVIFAWPASPPSCPAMLSVYTLGLATRFMVFSILAISLDLLWGYGGVVSFGHAMFFGLGAYAVAITLSYVGGVGGTLLGLALGMAVPALLLALALGLFLFYSKVSGVYFGIVTLALTVVFETIAIVSRDFTGGLDGLYGFDIPTIWLPGLGDVDIWGMRNPFYAALVGLVRGVPGRAMDHRVVLRRDDQGDPR